MANRLEHRLVAAANADLRRHRFVAPVDVLIGLGWLSKEHAEAWRRRRVPYLEQVTEASLGKLSSALRILQSWAQSEGLQPRETIYVSWTPSRHRLRFTKTGEENLERAYRTHWISPELIEAEQQRKAEAAARRAALLAYELEAVSRAAFLAHRMTAEDPGSDPGLPRSCGPPLTRPRMTGPAAPGPWSRRSRTRLSTPSPFLPGPCLSVRTRPWRWRPGAPAPEATRLAAARSLPLALDRDAGHPAGLAPANGQEKRTYPNVAGDRPYRMRCGSSWSHRRGRAHAGAIAVSRASCGFLAHVGAPGR